MNQSAETKQETAAVGIPAKDMELHIACDSERCVGCHACATACKVWRETPPGLHNRRIEKRWEGEGPAVRLHFESVACRHCVDPACLKACKYGAISKHADGIVVVSQAKCVGCRACREACPFDVPQFRNFGGSRRMQKCDLCEATRTADNPLPPCVETCPTSALVLERVPRSEKTQAEQRLKTFLQQG